MSTNRKRIRNIFDDFYIMQLNADLWGIKCWVRVEQQCSVMWWTTSSILGKYELSLVFYLVYWISKDSLWNNLWTVWFCEGVEGGRGAIQRHQDQFRTSRQIQVWSWTSKEGIVDVVRISAGMFWCNCKYKCNCYMKLKL